MQKCRDFVNCATLNQYQKYQLLQYIKYYVSRKISHQFLLYTVRFFQILKRLLFLKTNKPKIIESFRFTTLQASCTFQEQIVENEARCHQHDRKISRHWHNVTDHLHQGIYFVRLRVYECFSDNRQIPVLRIWDWICDGWGIIAGCILIQETLNQTTTEKNGENWFKQVHRDLYSF